jgi:plasmid stabilization system protein ParE
VAQKKIIWTETAASQRRSIFEYWLQRNQSNVYPLKLLRLSNEKANQIAANPMLYKAADFPNMRVATMGHFSLFYKITSDTIIITAFWDNRQDPGKLLELLKAQQDEETREA